MAAFLAGLKRLRIEEMVAVAFCAPMAVLTLLFVGKPGCSKGVELRFDITCLGILVYSLFLWRSRSGPLLRTIRDIAPFVFCILIYTNLHDLVYFIHPTNIDPTLIRIDQTLFGTQLSIVAQRFQPCGLIRWLQFCYSQFVCVPVTFALTLYLQQRYPEYRRFLVSVTLTFFSGYFLYVIFPAVGPKHYLKEYFQNPDLLNWRVEEDLYRFFQIAPRVRRDAFPSLHTAVTVVTTIFAFRYCRTYFYISLPFHLSLIVSTVYLGHHYLIDVLAGVVLALLACRYFPRLEDRWQSRQVDSTIPCV